MIKTFRGRLEDGAEDIIRLGTNDGLTGYKIKKLQIIAERPGHTNVENLLKVWSVKPKSAPDEYVNFNTPTLLAVAYYANHASNKTDASTIIFDSVVFNQDIYVNHKDIDTGEACNYYLELEQVTLNINEATVATLKDMRGRE